MRNRCVLLMLILLAVPHQSVAASALGQLEGLAGRSASSVKVPMPKLPTMVPSGTSGVTGALSGAGKASSALGTLNMGLQLLDMLDALDAPAVDNTQQLLEQQRQEQERLQILRQQSAELLRSSWDQADADHAASLGGVLDVPVRSGTAFFGIPGNPSGSVLPGQPAPVATPPAPAPAQATLAKNVRQTRNYTTGEPEAPQLTTEPIPAHNEILTKGYQEYSRQVAKDVLKDGFEKSLALLPAKWNAELIYEHKEKMVKFIDEIFTTLEPKRLVNTIVHGTPTEMAQLEQQISRETTDSARRLGFGETILDEDEPKFLLRWGSGEKVSAGEAWGLVKGRIYSTLVDKTSDRLFYGED